ncbi:Aste57867_17236 [Aphanomyces stellatus]|uniref:Aste57867_17236 protein n=1 Tax=Aphanomyces stellatus TaxID=120398 RepID=A0A485L949_9STRA|nr:hypothetical protein As57867_017177 [Aphanomyces stellatus]VFT93992.1 Aste57867_17236 [Aphanomyces stellatus]
MESLHVAVLMPRRLSCVLLLVAGAVAYSEFRYKIPSGFDVKGVPAVGHENKQTGGPDLTPFALDFIDNGYTWNKALCELDSDGDGATNGEELGDPCCLWNEIEDDTPLRQSDLTSPGHEDVFSAAQLDAIRCHATKEEL